MKRNHKILTVAVACMLLVASLVVTAIVAGAEDYTGNVATLSEKIAAVESASNAGKMDAFRVKISVFMMIFLCLIVFCGKRPAATGTRLQGG